MTSHHRWLVAAVAVAVSAMLALPSLAEVRVRTTRTGDYRMLQILTGPEGQARIWGAVSEQPDPRLSLNLEGDRNGDLWPRIEESSVVPHHPWVVWSRHSGREYDLAWSRWDPSGWHEIDWVEPAGSPGDDLDADVTFDPAGRPYIVWWRNEGGRGQVYLSLFLLNRWMEPYLVTDGRMDSRFPTIELDDQGSTITVEYETDAGTLSQLVIFDRPVTITDNIDPLDCLRMDHAPVIVSSGH